MSGCTVQRLEAPGLTFLKVSGTIDESFSASQLSQQIRADTILHLGKVGRFSSFGVREWVRLMKELQGRVKHCILVECSPAVVNQLNMVVDFAAGAHVKSVQLPYACQNCELDKSVTVDIDAQRQDLLQGIIPQVACPQCQQPMVFDDIPSSYLAFLRDSVAPEAGSPMAGFIASFEQAAPKLAEAEAGPSAPQPPPMAAAVKGPSVAQDQGAPAGKMSPAVKWAAAAAVLLVAAGVAWTTMGRREDPKPVDPGPVVVTPPPPPPKRDLASQEVLELNAMLGAKSFDKAEIFIRSLEPVLKDEAKTQAMRLVQQERIAAVENHLTKARSLISGNRVQEAREELDQAIKIGGESDGATFTRLQLERRANNCPAVIAAAKALAEGFPESTFLKQAEAAKKVCETPPAVPAGELRRAMAALQADIDGCLNAPREGDPSASIDLAWTVTPGGAPKDVSCTTPSMAKSELCQCLTEQVRRMRFGARGVRRGAYTFTTGTSG